MIILFSSIYAKRGECNDYKDNLFTHPQEYLPDLKNKFQGMHGATPFDSCPSEGHVFSYEIV